MEAGAEYICPYTYSQFGILLCYVRIVDNLTRFQITAEVLGIVPANAPKLLIEAMRQVVRNVQAYHRHIVFVAQEPSAVHILVIQELFVVYISAEARHRVRFKIIDDIFDAIQG